MRLKRIAVLVAAGIALPFAMQSKAETFPDHTVKIVVPYAAGSGVDVAARPLAYLLGQELGQSVIVENRAGASGTIATAYVAASRPDGYTVLFDTSSHTSAPLFIKNLNYDVVKDFEHVTTVNESPTVLVVRPDSGYKTLADLLAAMKQKPDALTYGSAGIGSQAYMGAAQMLYAAHVKALHIPYKSSVDAMTEVLSGRITFTFTGMGAALPLIKDHRLIALAVAAKRRSAALPDVPTVEEAGVPNGTYIGWTGLMVPAKTPPAVVQRLHDAVVKVLDSPELKEKFANLGLVPWTMSSAEFDEMTKVELKRNSDLVQAMQ